jgi:hypothetical protein
MRSHFLKNLPIVGKDAVLEDIPEFDCSTSTKFDVSSRSLGSTNIAPKLVARTSTLLSTPHTMMGRLGWFCLFKYDAQA